MALPITPIAKKSLVEYEGNVNFMYLDTRGKVTIGIGHLLAKANWAISPLLPFKYRRSHVRDSKNKKIDVVKGRLASEEHIKLEWHRINALKKGQVAAKYDPHADLEIDSTAVEKLFNADFEKHFKQAKNIFPELAQYPLTAQEAIIHMVYGLGENGLRKFKKFRKAVEKRDWAAAMAESKVGGWEGSKRQKLLDTNFLWAELEEETINKIKKSPQAQSSSGTWA